MRNADTKNYLPNSAASRLPIRTKFASCMRANLHILLWVLQWPAWIFLCATSAHAQTQTNANSVAHAMPSMMASAKPISASVAPSSASLVLRERNIEIERDQLQRVERFLIAINHFELGLHANKLVRKTTLVPHTAHVLTTLNLPFFDDAQFNIEIVGGERTHSGGFALVGRVAGDPASSAVIVDNDGVVSIQVYVNNKRYRIEGDTTHGYRVAQIAEKPLADSATKADQHDDMVTPSPELKGAVEADAHKQKNKLSFAKVDPLDDGSIIDVMVLYTTAARLAAGGVAQMNANVDAQIAFTNLIYLNSNVVQRIRLVYKGEISHVERDVFDDLYAITHPSDGIVDEVLVLRDIYRADIVSVWGMWPQVGGVAYGNLVENQFAGAYAYNIVHAPVAAQPGNTVFAHELGHNMGLVHDTYVQPCTSIVTPEGSTIPTEIGYAHGYVDVVNRFRTVMSYGDLCFNTLGADCHNIPFHSNPLMTFDNRAAYPAASVAILGNVVHANERQTLNDTRESVANYRPSLTSLTGAGVLAFTKRTVEVAEGVGSITLTVSRHAGASGAVSVAYTTIPMTASANADYTTTTGTLTWLDGDSTHRTITVPIIQDSLLEGRETFRLDLGATTGGAIAGGFNGTGASVVVTIIDDEPDTYPAGGIFPSGFATPGASNGAWEVDTTRGYLSTASLRSAAVLGTATSPPYNQFSTSDMEYTGTFATGNISFAYLLSSYPVVNGQPLSGLQFSIDGTIMLDRHGGIFDWQTFSTFITAGTHTLKWRFYNALPRPCEGTQPVGAATCLDRVWVDAISLPLVASGPASHLAYITNSGSGTVSAIHIASKTVVATIPVGADPSGVGVHPNGTRVYITNSGSNTVSVIDTLAQAVIATIPVGAGPVGIAVNPAGTKAYVAHYGSAYIAVIDTATNTRLADIGSAFGSAGIAISPDGTRAYMANVSSVQAIDLINNIAITNTALSNNSFGVNVSRDGSKAYVVQNQAKRVSYINTATNQASNYLNVDGQPITLALNPIINRLYVTTGASFGNNIGNSVWIFNDGHEFLTSVPVGNTSYGVSVDASGAWVYVVNNGSDTVSVIDAALNTVVATIPVGNRPKSLGQFITPVSIPGAATQLLAARSSGQLSISFTPPSDGGSTITLYTATCQPGNISGTAVSSPIVITGLANGSAYNCDIVATNAKGNGAASATVTATPSLGTFINSVGTATFNVLSPSSFSVNTSGAPPTNISTAGTLPNGVTLSSTGILSGTPASGAAGTYAFNIAVANGTSTVVQTFTLTVAKIAQSINFAALANRSVTSAAFTVSATGGASLLPVTFNSLTTNVCTTTGSNGATVTLITGGTCTITANQAATVDYLAAPTITQSFVVRASQTITFGNTPALLPGGAATLSATGGASGIAVIFASTTPLVCTVSGTNGATLTGVSVGQCTITANQAGNTNFDAAPQVSISLTLGLASQTITYSTTPLPIGIAVMRFTAVGASDNPVILVSSTPAICTVSGWNITAIEFGLCTLTANQAGNASFSAAPEVTFSLRTSTQLQRQRSYHVAALLPNGGVLIAGGLHRSLGVQATAEIYNPVSKRWTATASMTRERMLATAATLLDGRVLVVGGLDSANIQVNTAEIYNPANGTWSAAGSMVLGRTGHTLTRLTDGRLLVAGGTDQGSAATEIYNPTTNTWSAGPNLTVGRAHHSAALLANGKVLVATGWRNSNFINSAELYDPAANTWSLTNPIAASRLYSSATLLNNGSVLVASGAANAERFNPATNTWSAGGALSSRQNHTATLLADGRVLVAGGIGTTMAATLYDQTANIWTSTTPLLFPRINHTATLLNDGSVLIAGGNGPGGYAEIQDTAELYRADMTLLDATLLQSTVNIAYAAVSLSVAGGIAPFSYALTAGALPSGMALSAAGILSGTPTVTGTFTFTITATDTNGTTAFRQFSLTIVPPLFNVTPSTASNGTISPAAVQPVYAGATVTFTVTPNFGYAANMGGTCGGALVGNTYTSATITGDCTVEASFNAIYTVPDAPIIGTAVAGVTSAIINFTPPNNNGGTPITFYTATCMPGARTTNGSVSPLTVTGVTAGVAVTCNVSATNGMGAGPTSASSNSIVPIGVPRTLNVSISGTGTGSITSLPTGISCLGVCTANYPSGTVVTLTATPSGASLFSGWTNVVCVGGNAASTCTFTITSTRNISAIFHPSATTPGAPVGVFAVAGAASATVSFSPGPTGGSPITSYTANCYVGGDLNIGATPVSSTTSPIFVTGLVPGTAVNCRVTATNAIGTSVNSGASAMVTPTASPTTFTISPSAGANGTISPSVATTVTSGATSAFTVTPNSGYSASVGGTCGGSLVGTTYTTNTVVADCTVVASFTLNVALNAVQSKKTHGAAGTFDLPISTVHLIGGNVDVEPRTIGAGHTIVFQFNQAVTIIGSVTAFNASANPVGVASAVINMSNTTEVIVTLTGIADASRVTVTLNGINGSLSSVVSLGFLVGDVNNNRSVGNTDIAAMKTRIGLNVDNTNFKYDINTSGTLTNTDIAAAKTRVGLGI